MTPATMMYQFMLMRLGCRDMSYVFTTVAVRAKILYVVIRRTVSKIAMPTDFRSETSLAN
jgi:hypothetical protein